jgi:hypothetical protein
MRRYLIPGPVRVLLWLAPLAMCGCASRSPIEIWQRDLERYVAAHDNDLHALIELNERRSHRTLRPGRIEFRTVTKPAFAAGHDVRGVLIDSATYDRQRWYVFAVVSRPRNQDVPQQVQVLAARPEPGAWQWRASEGNPEALRNYLATHAGTPLREYPADTDQFKLVADGPRIRVQEPRSAAIWELLLSGPASPGSAAGR